MTGVLECHVLGAPAPQGSKRGIVVGGRARVIESSKAVKPWREAIVAQVRDQLDGQTPVSGPVYVALTFYLPRPKVAKADTYSAKRPDVDKLVRSTLDGLTTAGVFADDSQVAVLVAEKRYVDDEHPLPGAFLTVESLTIVESA